MRAPTGASGVDGSSRRAMLRDVVPAAVAVSASVLLLVMGARTSPFVPVNRGPTERGLGAAGDPSLLGSSSPGVSASSRGQRDARHPYLPWATEVGTRIGIPARALAAYAAAEVATRESIPGCRLSWVTLAGIGAVESGHGTDGAATINDDGLVTPPVVGPALDGSTGFRAIADTDGGSYDGDRRWDRAVGPMQFIPETWQNWRADGNEDGMADPHNFDDAALAAARYLCASGLDTGTGEGWTDAVFSYNHSADYVRQVFAHARLYAARSR